MVTEFTGPAPIKETAYLAGVPPMVTAFFISGIVVLLSIFAFAVLTAAIVQDTIRNLRDRKVEFKDLVFSVNLYHDPKEKLASRVLPQPYQCVAQLSDSGEEVKQGNTAPFIKVKPITYHGRQFTVKPADWVQSVSEINAEDYVRNLTTALNQTFRPMGIRFETEAKVEAKITDWLVK